MARIARLVVPHYPHHITQRGNRRQQTFFSSDDYQAYIDLLSFHAQKLAVGIWAYCLMPNHVHIVAVPTNESGLSKCLSRTHRAYALKVNKRNEWKGHLWQERFYSYVMDENHLLSAVRYTELNPVRAGLCSRPEDWPWSSTAAHLSGDNDQLTEVEPMLERVENWSSYLAQSYDSEFESIRLHTRTGRPAGKTKFLLQLEAITGRELRKRKTGPKG